MRFHLRGHVALCVILALGISSAKDVIDAAVPEAAAPVQTPPSESSGVPAEPAAASPKAKDAVEPSETPSRAVETSVVRVFATVRYPALYKPWTRQSPSEVTGSGVVIEGKRILTNAHVVLYASQVQVQANQAGDKVSATVEAIVPSIDLAVLKLDDTEFFDSHPPLSQARTLPEIKDAVTVYGFPTGGTGLAITKGIVSG
jgi:S1-C subfamily serine protease